VKVMPKNTPSVLRSSSPTTRVIHRTALAAVALAAIGGVITTTLVTQAAVADQAAGRISATILNESTGMRSEQLALDGAILQKRTADAVAAVAAAAAAAQAAYLASPAGAQATAHDMAASQYGWGDDQFGCLVSLWQRESGWNAGSYNAGSGATGIPQALPGEKMAIAGADWQTNPATQIAWGLGYIASSYGTPCAAWNHSESYNWY
jgi:hypothetical protein